MALHYCGFCCRSSVLGGP